MQSHDLFSLKTKQINKILECHLLQILLGILSVDFFFLQFYFTSLSYLTFGLMDRPVQTVRPRLIP